MKSENELNENEISWNEVGWVVWCIGRVEANRERKKRILDLSVSFFLARLFCLSMKRLNRLKRFIWFWVISNIFLWLMITQLHLNSYRLTFWMGILIALWCEATTKSMISLLYTNNLDLRFLLSEHGLRNLLQKFLAVNPYLGVSALFYVKINFIGDFNFLSRTGFFLNVHSILVGLGLWTSR